MDFELSEEQKMIVDMCRRFVREEILPLEEKLDPDADELEPEDFSRLSQITKDMGLFGLDTPPEFGGPDINLLTRTLIAFEISQHRAGLYAPSYNVFGGASQAQLFEATDAQKEKYLYPMLRGEKKVFFGLSEPSGGSDPARAIQTRAVRDGDDWIINGQKLWISGADKADYGLVFARTDPSKGRGGVTCFIVDADTPGFHVRRIVHTLRSSRYATELQFEDMRVPHENILGEEGGGFAIANDRLSRQRIPYANERRQFGKSIVHFPRVAGKLAWMAVETMVSRQLTYFSARQKDSDRRCDIEAGMAKLLAARTAWSNADNGVQIHGGNGYAEEYEMSRLLCDARILNIFEGAAEIQAQVIARGLLDRRN
jgi:acyl-CoA dehydrogenase